MHDWRRIRCTQAGGVHIECRVCLPINGNGGTHINTAFRAKNEVGGFRCKPVERNKLRIPYRYGR